MASLVRSPCLTCPTGDEPKTECAGNCELLASYRKYLKTEGMVWMPPPTERVKMEKPEKPRYEQKTKAMFAVMEHMPIFTIFCLDDLIASAQKLCGQSITRGTASTFLSLFTRAGYGSKLHKKARPGQPARYERIEAIAGWETKSATFSGMQNIVARKEHLQKAKEKADLEEKARDKDIKPGPIQPSGAQIETVPIQLNVTIDLGTATISVLELLREIAKR